MSKILVVAEKPSVARDIAKALKCNSKGEMYIFSEHYIVTWAIGHLVTLCEPEDYNKALKKWSYNTLPIIPDKIKLKPINTTKKQLSVVKKLMNSKDVESIVCATDSGREGELIFRYIYEIINCKKTFKRLWISSMTETSILEGFKNLKDGHDYNNLYESAKCRSHADWLVGINATRAYTIKYGTLLSIGRVQTPTLAIIVKREKEIKDFKPEEYYEVKASFEKYSSIWFDEKTKKSKIKNKENAENLIKSISHYKEGIVKEILQEEKQQLPSLLYDLTELQRDCNKIFGFTANKTLSIAQNLYEKSKLITYPRTDSRHLSSDMIPKINYILNTINIEPYKKYISYILNLDKLPITNRIVDNNKVTEHPAIIPTGVKVNLNSIGKDELKIYDLIARKFISVFYPPYKYKNIDVITSIGRELFISKYKSIIQLGYLEVLNLKNQDENKQNLPDLKLGQNVKILNIEILTKKTSPPKLYTEASLLSVMETPSKFIEKDDLKEQIKKFGLGTPATRASIIERLISVGYIIRKSKNLIPTEKAIKLIDILPKELTSPETTGKWEKGLTSIEKGNMHSSKFNESIEKYVNYIIQCSSEYKKEVAFPTENKNTKTKKPIILGNCPKCSGYILENAKAFYCSNWKTNCNFTIWKNCLSMYGINITNTIIKKLLDQKLIKEIDVISPVTKAKEIGSLRLTSDLKVSIEIKNRS